jgi:hypothetical protein
MIGIATIILGVLILITSLAQSLLHIRFTTGDLLMLIASFFLRKLYHFSSAKTKGATSQSLSVQYFFFWEFFSLSVYLWNTSLISALF